VLLASAKEKKSRAAAATAVVAVAVGHKFVYKFGINFNFFFLQLILRMSYHITSFNHLWSMTKIRLPACLPLNLVSDLIYTYYLIDF
jgi:hypothetical protein